MRYTVKMNESSQKGVGPHPLPYPVGSHYDLDLLQHGDARNVQDVYRYWKADAIKEDILEHAHELEVAIENLDRDFNMGTIVRTANAFAVRRLHIIGRKQWNKRGAMMTDVYLDVVYHASVEAFLDDIKERGRSLVAIETGDTSISLSQTTLPQNAVLLFGSEANGISARLQAASDQIVSIEQFGSTRSLNVGVAAGIALYMWVHQNVLTHHR